MNYQELLDNTHVESMEPVITPHALKQKVPLTNRAAQTVYEGRQSMQRILEGKDDRLIVVMGPCSIHNTSEALGYAQTVAELSKSVCTNILVVMRCYFEKPRTTFGWEGLIPDPYMDGSGDINVGLETARKFLMDVTELGLPVCTEFLDPFTPQYIGELVSMGAIGARTTESSIHRRMVSGFSMPVGFKNGTGGSVQVAVDAMVAASKSKRFKGINDFGEACIVKTKGNPDTFTILRGGHSGPNYEAPAMEDAVKRLTNSKRNTRLMVDCSHANSGKDPRKQGGIFKNLIDQRTGGNENIMGVMIESYINEGAQKLPDDLNGFDRSTLKPGISVTDGCVGRQEGESLILGANEKLGKVRSMSGGGVASPSAEGGLWLGSPSLK